MDTAAARHVPPGAGLPPFNFSINPTEGHHHLLGGTPADVTNFFSYSQMGNVGLVAFSGAHPLEQLRPLLAEACAWLPKQAGLRVAVIMGHWDHSGDGSTNETTAPGLFEIARQMAGCKLLDQRRMLKFVCGHVHCNIPHPHGHVGTGFMVGGQGMTTTDGDGCHEGANFGVPLLATTAERVRVWYFPVATMHNETDQYDAVHTCVSERGWSQCTHLATMWLDEPLPPPFSPLEVSAPAL